jgi:hypothetical protein
MQRYAGTGRRRRRVQEQRRDATLAQRLAASRRCGHPAPRAPGRGASARPLQYPRRNGAAGWGVAGGGGRTLGTSVASRPCAESAVSRLHADTLLCICRVGAPCSHRAPSARAQARGAGSGAGNAAARPTGMGS